MASPMPTQRKRCKTQTVGGGVFGDLAAMSMPTPLSSLMFVKTSKTIVEGYLLLPSDLICYPYIYILL